MGVIVSCIMRFDFRKRMRCEPMNLAQLVRIIFLGISYFCLFVRVELL